MTSADVKWIATHAKELGQYEGKYVGIMDGRVIASAETSGQVIQKVNQLVPNANVVIMLVPPKSLSS
jgi:ketol-acid reductoisomerase